MQGENCSKVEADEEDLRFIAMHTYPSLMTLIRALHEGKQSTCITKEPVMRHTAGSVGEWGQVDPGNRSGTTFIF